MKAEYGFSFLYGDTRFTQNNLSDGRININNELEVNTKIEYYDKYNSKYWVNEYCALADTKIISQLNDIDIFIEFDKAYISPVVGRRHSETTTTVTSFRGSNCNECEGEPIEKEIRPGEVLEYACEYGRSASGTMPYFRINCGDSGVIVAIGWTGQWKCKLECTDKGISFIAGIEDSEFYLKKGEKIRTASAIVTEYNNGAINGHNMLRRTIKERCVIGKGERRLYADVSAMTWGAMKSSTMIEHIEGFIKNDIGVECMWIDAGWHGHSVVESKNEHIGDWWLHVGSWNIHMLDHPDALEEVSKKIGDNNMRLLLWAEIERVADGSDWDKEYSDYLISDNEHCKLLDLGKDEAVELAYNTLSEVFEKLNVICYRQDFNCEPLAVWRNNDSKDRKGITEINYINGLYKLWDKLLQRFPKLYIDNCSSGGRRNDIEMLSRSVALWRSDYQCSFDADSDNTQAHNTGFSCLFPYSATGINGEMDDVYEIRSCYGSGFNAHNWWWTEDNPVEYTPKMDILKKTIREYKKIRHLFGCDFYPLTPYDRSKENWCVWQYNSPEDGEGVVIAFRREKSPISSMKIQLNGLSGDDYIFTNYDTNEKFTVNGEELMKNGLEISLQEKRSSTVFAYRKNN